MIEYGGKAPVSMLSDFLLKTGFLLSGPDKQAQVRASTLLLIYSEAMERERLMAMELVLALSEYARKDKPAAEKARITYDRACVGRQHYCCPILGRVFPFHGPCRNGVGGWTDWKKERSKIKSERAHPQFQINPGKQR